MELRAQAARVDALLVMRLVAERLGRDFAGHALLEEPEAVSLDVDGVTLDYGPELAYLVLESGEVVEIRTRSTWLECYTFSRSGRYLGSYTQPLGDPALN